MTNTIFEKVISGEFDGSFVFKDEVCAVFMDLNPFNPGHLLVVPRAPIERLTSLSPKTVAHLFVVAQRVLKAIELSDMKCDGANVFLSDGAIAGQEVPHVHLHVVPRFTGDGIQISFGKPIRQENRNELNRVAAIISSSLN